MDPRVAEPGRFVANIVIATAVHHGVLIFDIRVLDLPSAGLANFLAAWFGITFVDSRLFVVRREQSLRLPQAPRFLALCASVAMGNKRPAFPTIDTR